MKSQEVDIEPMTDVNAYEFQIIQSSTMRGVFDCYSYTPLNSMFNYVCMFSVNQKIIFNVFVFNFMIRNKLLQP